jgi:AcrR family transcriptional regulator
MNGFEKRRQQKKDSILKAAKRLFNQYGFDKVTIAEIAKEAQVSPASVYNFFGSKENLKQQLLRKIKDDHYRLSMEILESGEPIKRKLERLLASRVEFYGNYSPAFLSGMESLNDTETHQYKEFTRAFFRLIEEGQKEGVINDSISAEAIGLYLEIIRYYFANKPSATQKFANNPGLTKELFTLFTQALTK